MTGYGKNGLQRYRHIGPAGWGEERCSATGPGSTRACTRRKDHAGPHVVHGFLGRVVAAWDSGTVTSVERREVEVPEPRSRPRPVGLRSGTPPSPLAALARLARRALAAWDQIAFIVLFVVFVKFALDVLKTLY